MSDLSGFIWRKRYFLWVFKNLNVSFVSLLKINLRNFSYSEKISFILSHIFPNVNLRFVIFFLIAWISSEIFFEEFSSFSAAFLISSVSVALSFCCLFSCCLFSLVFMSWIVVLSLMMVIMVPCLLIMLNQLKRILSMVFSTVN